MTRKVRKGSAPFKPASSKVRAYPKAALGWTSGNWSGYAIKKAKRNAYRSVSGYWRVPKVRPSKTNKYSSTWVGIDGFGNNSLIQTGTEQDYVKGKAVYYAWWEILPAPETKIRFPVSPNDLMYARISKRCGTNQWLIILSNKTKGWTFRKVTKYNGPASTAEWIMEAPSIDGEITRLARYNKFPFSRCRVNRKNPLLKPGNRGVMIQNKGVVSTPSLPNRTKDGFFVAYGSKTPSPPKSK
ncbi:G1 family glutamic endopeptidase [Paenibacillus rigui]|uniref:G1 family glutamic endopeptidase n=1 Tax=Paenibacillus rigui TaxID=554312 RepID=UPI0015C61A89|nr:G1 family glutamic endopeptidase [Paenibacillus rigui]